MRLHIAMLLCVVPIIAAQPNSSLDDALQKILDTASNLSLGTAITLGVALPNRTIALAAGNRDMHAPNSANVTPSDAFAMGSAAKMFTAAAVLRLIDAGKFSLDDQALPLLDTLWTQLNGSSIVNLLGPQMKNVTVRHLLQMQSGIPDFDNLESRGYQFDNPTLDLGPVKELSFIATQKLTCDPGTCGEYSSSNFELLGLLLAQQAGAQSWDDYNQAGGLPKGVLAEMPHTTFAVHGFCSKFTDVHAYSAERSPPVDVYNMSCTSGWTCGNLISSGADVAVFVRALLGKGERVVKASTQVEMLKTAPFTVGWSQGLMYGLGVMDLSRFISMPAGSFFGHGGDTYGFNGQVGYSAEHDIGIGVFANTENSFLISRVMPDVYNAVVSSLSEVSTFLV